MEFQVRNAPTIFTEREVILQFLDSIDPQALSGEALDRMGWGGEEDPISNAVAILRERAEKW